MVTQFYIFEIQQYQNGEYGDIRHIAFDEDAEKARLKAESKYHEVLSAAAVSELPMHSAILVSSEGFPIMHQCYKKTVTPAVVEEEQTEPTE